MTIEIFLNGKKENIGGGKTLTELLKDKNIKKEVVTVEINSAIIDKRNYDKTKIKTGDKIEFVYYMGGGADVLIKVPSLLEKKVKKKEVNYNGDTVGEVLKKFADDYGIKDRIYDKQGNLNKFLNVYLDNEDIRFLNSIKTRLEGNSIITIIPAIAGGDNKDNETSHAERGSNSEQYFSIYLK